MVIDSHLHLIRTQNLNKDVYSRFGMKIPTDTNLDDLVRWLRDCGVEKAIVMGQNMSRIWDSTFGDEYVLQAIDAYPELFAGLISIEPINSRGVFDGDQFEYMNASIQHPRIRGILLTPPYGQYYANDRRVYPFYRATLDANGIVQFHHSAQKGPPAFAPTRYADMFILNDIVVDFPDLRIVVEHLGYPWTEHLFCIMANGREVWTDLAMLYDMPLRTTWSLVLAREYGVLDRIMYASDFVATNHDHFSNNPTDDMSRWLTFVRTGLNDLCRNCGWPLFSDEEIQGILWRNADRLYGLL